MMPMMWLRPRVGVFVAASMIAPETALNVRTQQWSVAAAAIDGSTAVWMQLLRTGGSLGAGCSLPGDDDNGQYSQETCVS